MNFEFELNKKTAIPGKLVKDTFLGVKFFPRNYVLKR
jgi:hypothetical protein